MGTNLPFSRILTAAAPLFCLGLALATGSADIEEARANSRWRSQSCSTRPNTTLEPMLCQQLSDRFGIVHGVTWGRAGTEAQGLWKAMGCQATPSDL